MIIIKFQCGSYSFKSWLQDDIACKIMWSVIIKKVSVNIEFKKNYLNNLNLNEIILIDLKKIERMILIKLKLFI